MFQLLDSEFARLSPTWKTKGGNPSQVPEGAGVEYTTPANTLDPNAPAVLRLSFAPLGPGPNGETLPTLNPNGTEGVYVGTGALGAATVVAKPTGSIESWATEVHDVEVRPSQPDALNSTFGAAAAESSPA